MTVAVEALVQASGVAKVGGGAIRRDDTFRHSADCRCVVGCVPDGGVAHFPVVDHDVNLPQQSGVLEIAVGDGAAGVGRRHEAVLDFLR